MIVLGIETSCDETAVAILELNGKRPKVLANLIASQHEIHSPYGGIFPELASRRHLEVLCTMTEEALKKAGLPLKKIDGIAVTREPGLVGSLLVGLSFAKAVAFARQIPFIGVNHLEGHLNAIRLEQPRVPLPHIALIVSGGHSALFVVRGFGKYRFLGGTRDDAAGEAFDKVAKLLELGYPGGPEIDRRAKEGRPGAVKLPQPNLKLYDMSFSGLKTAVRNLVEKEKPDRNDLAASFQEVVVDHLVAKSLAAARAHRCRAVVVTGGVACNSRLREKMGEACRKIGRRSFFPSPELCTDNAMMIAYVGGRYLALGRRSPLSLNAVAVSDLARLS